MIAKLICYFRGHLRGKRDRAQSNQEKIVYRCPRCGGTWTRKPAKGKA